MQCVHSFMTLKTTYVCFREEGILLSKPTRCFVFQAPWHVTNICILHFKVLDYDLYVYFFNCSSTTFYFYLFLCIDLCCFLCFGEMLLIKTGVQLTGSYNLNIRGSYYLQLTLNFRIMKFN